MNCQGPPISPSSAAEAFIDFEIDYQTQECQSNQPVAQQVNDFPYWTVHLLINRRQEPGHYLSTSPLVIVQNEDEQGAGSLLSGKMCDLYWVLRDRQEEPRSKIETIFKQIEASAMNKMWAAIGLSVERDEERGLCFPTIFVGETPNTSTIKDRGPDDGFREGTASVGPFQVQEKSCKVGCR